MTNKFRKQIGQLGNQRGFTLIELIIVIVILGILAAVAIPKYTDIRAQAAIAAANGVFGAAQSATAVNFSTRLVSQTSRDPITSISRLVSAMDGGPPTGWTVSGNSLRASLGGATYWIAISANETDSSKATIKRGGW